MGKVHQFGSVILRVIAGDHLPPHFHVNGPDFDATVTIADLSVIGSLPVRVRREVLAWATENRHVLAAEWNRTNSRFPIA